ncbi:MAG: PAS domain S-box protein [bacterium]
MEKKKTDNFNIKAESFFDIAGVMFVVIDRKGDVRRINQKGCKILGYSKKKIIGKNWFEHFLPQRYRTKGKNIHSQLMTGKIKPVEYYENPVLTKDGQQRIIAWHNTVLRDKDKNIIGTLSSGEDITVKEESLNKIQHLTQVLRAIRNVNQLISKEKDRDVLIQKVCKILIEGSNYNGAWIILLDDNNKPIVFTESGLGKKFTDYIVQMKKGRMYECCRRALTQTKVVVIDNANSDCNECPLLERVKDKRAMTVRLEYGGKVYGLLSVILSANFAFDKEEQSLFSEVAGDIAFALYSIEIEKERIQAVELMKKSQEIAHIGSWRLDLRTNHLIWSDEVYKIFGLDPQEFDPTYENFLEAIHPEDREIVNEIFKKSLKNKQSYNIDHRILRPDGTVRIVQEKCEHIIDKSREIFISVGMVHDITERKRGEEFTKAQRDLALAVSKTSSVKEILRLSVKTVLSISDMDACGIYFIDKDSGALKLMYNQGLTKAFVDKVSFYSAESRQTKLVQKGKPVHLQYLELDVPMSKEERKEGIKAFSLIPIWYKNEVIGSLNVASHTLKKTPPYACRALETIAGQMGASIVRARTEKKLQKSEELFRNVFESIKEGILVVDKNYRYSHWSTSMEEISNTGREEVIGKIPWKKFPFLEGNIKKAIKKAMKGEPVLNEKLQYKLKNGKEGWTSESYFPLYNRDGKVKGVVGVIEEITQRKQAEEALRKSEEKYRTFFKTTRDCVFISSREGCWLDFNDAAVELFGYNSKEELSKVRIPDLYAKSEDRIRHIKLIKKQGYVKENPVDLKKKDGSIIHTLITTVSIKNDQGEVIAFQGTIRDITEQKRAESAIRESERQLKTLLGNLPGMVYRCKNVPAWTMEFVSMWASSLTGYKPSELINNKKIAYGDVIHPADRKAVWEGVQKAIKKKKHFELEYRIITKKKKQKWVWERGRGVFINGSQIILEGFISDITERKRVEKALRDSEKKFRKSIMEAPFPAMVHAEDGEVILVNKMWKTISGYKFKEISTISDWIKKVYGERKNKVKEDIDKLYSLNKNIDEGEYTINTKQGGKVIWHFSSSSLCIDEKDRRLVLSMAHDVTRQKRMEEKQKQTLYELNFINDTIIRTSRLQDIDTICNYVGEVIHKVNPRVYIAVSLYDPKVDAVRIRSLVGFGNYIDRLFEIAGKNSTQLYFHPEEIGDMVNLYTTGKLEYIPGGLYKLMEGKVPKAACRAAERLLGIENAYTIGFALENRPYGGIIILTARGQEVNYSSAIETIASHVSEILQRRQMEKSIKESQERYNALYNRSLDLVFVHNFQGKFLDANAATLNQFGYSKEEIKTLNFSTLLADKDQQSRVQESLKELVKTGYQKELTQFRLRSKDGKIIWVETKASVIYKEGKPYAIQGIARDITERKRAEQQIKSNLNEKEVLLKEVHHRVKNNLNIIVSLLNLQSEQIKNKEQALSALSETRDRVYSMALIHDQLYQTDNFSNINMKTYIQTMARGLMSSLSSGKKVSVNIEIKDIYLNINKAIPCGLILNEIVTNCLKHAFPKRGKGKILIEFHRYNNQYEFLVRDDGVGLPEKIDIKKSKSLGLKLIHLLTKQLGGNITIKKKKGTEFRIIFPVEEEHDG